MRYDPVPRLAIDTNDYTMRQEIFEICRRVNERMGPSTGDGRHVMVVVKMVILVVGMLLVSDLLSMFWAMSMIVGMCDMLCRCMMRRRCRWSGREWREG